MNQIKYQICNFKKQTSNIQYQISHIKYRISNIKSYYINSSQLHSYEIYSILRDHLYFSCAKLDVIVSVCQHYALHTRRGWVSLCVRPCPLLPTRSTERVSLPKGVGYPLRVAHAASFKFGTVLDTGFTEALVICIADTPLPPDLWQRYGFPRC